MTTSNYNGDSVDDSTNINNYVKVPWETYSESETCTDTENNKCWRIMSINPDGSITIVRDKNQSNKAFDNTYNTSGNGNYGYNDLLENVYTTGHPEEYRATSQMYTHLYGQSGYQNTTLKNFFNLLNTFDICLNKVSNYVGVNDSSYATNTSVKDTCDVTGKSNTIIVNPLKNQYVRLPYQEEYLNATLETTCTKDYQYQCRNQNFMYNNTNYWSLNGMLTSSMYVRYVGAVGYTSGNLAYNTFGVRPVVNLKSTILISGGTGSNIDPYVIKF